MSGLPYLQFHSLLCHHVSASLSRVIPPLRPQRSSFIQRQTGFQLALAVVAWPALQSSSIPPQPSCATPGTSRRSDLHTTSRPNLGPCHCTAPHIFQNKESTFCEKMKGVDARVRMRAGLRHAMSLLFSSHENGVRCPTCREEYPCTLTATKTVREKRKNERASGGCMQLTY